MDARTWIRSSTLAYAALVASTVGADAQTPQWGIAATYPIAAGAVAVDVADLNLDGMLDVVAIPVQGSGGATVMLGQPGGTFQVQPVVAGSGLYGPSLALGLLDGDSFPDAFTGYLMHGNGDGTFTQAPVQPVGFGGVTAVAVGDFNGDGRNDLVATNFGLLRIALADGVGGFLLPKAYPSYGFVDYLTVADVDADGDLDIVATCGDTYSATILTNNLPTGFSAQAYSRNGASRVAVGDFTGDSTPRCLSTILRHGTCEISELQRRRPRWLAQAG